ncbi:hypothetical protein PIB30_100130 [Stylosanthes scabra]|uniref:ABC-2 type transporter transmembrane domain-containing protein n=1 Tax=Stylosanthes scabra TaxID=79078 RepID=A0ABU6ZVS5_9FABA|nr:hypothetical protein [Stylosanthes scabra]
MAVGPSLMIVFIVFGGYYVNPKNTPIIFHWIPNASLIRWAFQGLCINEFNDLQFEYQNSFDIQAGEQVNRHMMSAIETLMHEAEMEECSQGENVLEEIKDNDLNQPQKRRKGAGGSTTVNTEEEINGTGLEDNVITCST